MTQENTHKSIRDIYYTSLSTTAATNVQYLNTTVAWSLSLLTGGLAVIFSRESFPDENTVFIIYILYIILVHFFIRACKAYVNMIRFTTIEKIIIDESLSEENVQI